MKLAPAHGGQGGMGGAGKPPQAVTSRSDTVRELTQQADSGRCQPCGSPQTTPRSEVDVDASAALSHRNPKVSTAQGSLEAVPENQLLRRKWCEEGTFIPRIGRGGGTS